MRADSKLVLLACLPALLAMDCGGGGKGDPCFEEQDCGLAYTCYQTDPAVEGICLTPEQVPSDDTSEDTGA